MVLDAANGMAGLYLPPVLDRLAIDAVPCFLELDGRFPNHEPNPLLPENRAFIEGKVVEEKADLGIAFDGDADRCFFIDDTGEFVPGDFLTALLARHLLARNGPATVVYDLRASWAVRDTVEAAGGSADEHRVGHAFIKRRMREVNALFGGEVSGHYYFRDFSFADSGLIPALLVLEMLAQVGRPLSELVADFRGQVPHLRRDQLDRRGRPGRAAARCASATPTAARPRWTACRWRTTTGTSTCAPRTPSRSCASTWSRCALPRTWSAGATRCSR